MLRQLSWTTAIVLCLAASSLSAQTQSEPWPRTNPIRTSPAADQPDQPVNPQLPTLQRRPAPAIDRQSPPPPPPPFKLTPQEEAQLDRALTAWEQKGKEVKTFDCSFVRWEYDPVFAKPNSDPNAPAYTEKGYLKYAAPDKGVFEVTETQNPAGKWAPIEEDRADHWICDGKSVFQYIPRQKQLVEHKLPPEMQGKAIVDGPLPFLFGTEAQKIRQRYFIRLITPPPDKQNQIWLEAYPRYQADAANFRRAMLVLNMPGMTPKALQIYQPNGKSRTSYEFFDIVLNDPLRLFQGNPFQTSLPRGWKMIIDDAATTQAGRPAGEVR